jgi:DNA-binding LytR/AlgR family response regulator
MRSHRREASRGGRCQIAGAQTPRPARDGATNIAVEGIVAVHANAHYTYVFDGSLEYFCPLPISEVEARLDADLVRVHRSTSSGLIDRRAEADRRPGPDRAGRATPTVP